MELITTSLRTIRSKPAAAGFLLAAFLLLFLAACSDQGGGGSGNSATPVSETDLAAEERIDTQGKAAESEAGQTDPDPGPQSGSVSGLENDDGAQVQEASPTVEAASSAKIVVCLEGEAPDLFLYGDDSPAALAVRHALNENLYTSLAYAYQAQGLEKLPSLADGDARRLTVAVNEGDRVIDTAGNIVSLRKGAVVTGANGETADFTGETLEMEQLQVDFSFKPLVWSDGTPVSAVDSVFSFNVAADPQTATSKAKTNYTQSYEATGDLSVRWTGLPGFLDPTYFTNVWTPLPAHMLSRYTAAELTTVEDVALQPLSSGPYVVSEWIDTDTLLLAANPHYYRAADGLPLVQNITVQFGDIEALLAQEANCDVLADGVLGAHNLPALEESGELSGWEVLTSPGNVYEQIAFGIVPVTEYRERRPDWFGDSQVRQAIALAGAR